MAFVSRLARWSLRAGKDEQARVGGFLGTRLTPSGTGWRLLGVSLGAMVCLLAAGLWNEWRGYQAAKRGEVSQVNVVAARSAARVEHFITNHLETLRGIASAPPLVAGDVTAMRSYFARLEAEGLHLDLTWIDRQGRVSVAVESVRPLDVSQRPDVRSVLATGRAYVSDDLVRRGQRVPGSVLAVATLDSRGLRNGVLTSTMPLAALRSLARPMLMRDPSIRVVEADGDVILSGGPLTDHARVRSAALWAELRRMGDGSLERNGGLLGGPGRQLVSFATVASPGWKVVVERPAGVVFAAALHRLWVAIGTLFGAAILVLAMSLLLARRLARMVREQQAASERQLRRLEARRRRAQRRAELERLAEALAVATTSDEMLRLVSDTLRKLPDVIHTSLGLVDAAAGVIRFPYVEAEYSPFAEALVSGDIPSAQVVRDNETLLIPTRAEMDERFPLVGSRMPPSARAFALVPLRDANGDAIGVLRLAYLREHVFDSAHRGLLVAAASLLGQALERARLHLESEILQRLATALSASLTVEEIADSVFREALTTLGVTAASIGLIEDSSLFVVWFGPPEERPRRLGRVPLDSSLPGGAVALDGQPRWFSSATLAVTEFPAARGSIVGPVALLPLHSQTARLGFLCVHFGQSEHGFDAGERRLLSAIADQVAQALERARLYERERGVAVTLQRSLLADELPELPSVAFAARYLARGDGVEVGGDWYDVFERVDGRLCIGVGDVIGHGIPAAVLMGRQRNAFRAYSLEGHSPAGILQRLDRHVHGDEMATAACLELDVEGGSLRYASAGHPPPLLLDPASGRVEWLGAAHTIPLGISRDAERIEADVRLPEDALLLVYTDGLVERPGHDVYEQIAALAGLLGNGSASPLEALADQLVERCGPRFRDDVAFVLVRLGSQSAQLPLQLDGSLAESLSPRGQLRDGRGGTGLPVVEALMDRLEILRDTPAGAGNDRPWEAGA